MLFWVLSFVLLTSMTGAANAATFKVLYSFAAGSDAIEPVSGVILDSQGNLYGTAYNGGTSAQGAVFKITSAGVETVLYSFTGGADGGHPRGSLLLDKQGNLYGTTEYGGLTGNCSQGGTGCGVVFKVSSAGQETVLHSFSPTDGDGYTPLSGLVADAQGNLYGTTFYGGTFNFGTVYKLTPRGAESVLYSFAGPAQQDGFASYAGLVLDSQGNLYGAASGGGKNDTGIVFKVDKTGVETVLYSFGSELSGDGAAPTGGLIRDSAGNLYGTTANGGLAGGFGGGCGIVFKLDTSGNETILYEFTGKNGDGFSPQATLLRDPKGNLYGTTAYGGTCSLCGTSFMLNTAGKEVLLHSFTNQTDGGFPDQSGLVADKQGNGYGTTFEGGANGLGTVYKLSR
jgi:uncharacterized repeat protein (TIGR03803 family)